jgi:1-acyl-sn-glycerol-3-phosphate acyltransferase
MQPTLVPRVAAIPAHPLARESMSTMSAPIATPEGRATRDSWRLPRYALRLPLLALHLLVSLPLTLLAVALPHARRNRSGGGRYDHLMIRWWSGTLLRIFGIAVVRRGEPEPGAVLLVANHRSWLDIELIHSQRAACFVAKSEIASWPVVGWVAARGGTIYHRRGSTESLAAVAQVMVERLREGLAVAVFPEGGIRPGDRVHTFHARIFQPAIDAGVAAQPVALRFLRNGAPTTALAQGTGESFFASFWRLLGEPRSVAEVSFLAPVRHDGSGRRRLAEACRAQIAAALGQVETTRGAVEPPIDDLDPIASADASD